MRALWALLFCVSAYAADVPLVWDPNSETDLAGYKVYWGTASGVYGAPVTLPGTPSAPTYTVSNLTPGTYYFAVTAYNTAGLESGFSNEVSTTISSLSGDLNGDGAVNVMDLQSMVNVILGISTNPNADLNADQSVNVLDLQILVGMILSGG